MRSAPPPAAKGGLMGSGKALDTEALTEWLAAQKCDVALNAGLHRAPGKFAVVQAVTLALENRLAAEGIAHVHLHLPLDDSGVGALGAGERRHDHADVQPVRDPESVVPPRFEPDRARADLDQTAQLARISAPSVAALYKPN